MRVAFALVGNAAQPGARIDDEEWTRPWNERPKVELDVEEGEKLGSLVERALREFGVPLTEGLAPAHMVDLGLYEAGESHARASELTVVDDHGRVVWQRTICG
jgi:hypothetical protein